LEPSVAGPSFIGSNSSANRENLGVPFSAKEKFAPIVFFLLLDSFYAGNLPFPSPRGIFIARPFLNMGQSSSSPPMNFLNLILFPLPRRDRGRFPLAPHRGPYVVWVILPPRHDQKKNPFSDASHTETSPFLDTLSFCFKAIRLHRSSWADVKPLKAPALSPSRSKFRHPVVKF